MAEPEGSRPLHAVSSSSSASLSEDPSAVGEAAFVLPNSADETSECPQKSRKLKDQDTPKRVRVNTTIRSLMPVPVNHEARRKKLELRMKKMIAKNEAESVSDEEKSYVKSLRERSVMADAERREATAYRARYEQQRINSLFFSNTRKSTEESADAQKYRALITTDLWAPSMDFRRPIGVPIERISEESLNSPALTEYPSYRAPVGRSMILLGAGLPPRNPNSGNDGVAIPDVRTVPDYAAGWDDAVTSHYMSQYKQGYIAVKEPEPQSSSNTASTPMTSPSRHRSRAPQSLPLSRKSPGTPATPSSSNSQSRRRRSASILGNVAGASRSPPSLLSSRTGGEQRTSPTFIRTSKASRMWQYFHPTRWTQVEIAFAQTLLKVLGNDWYSISLCMSRTKSPAALERAYLRHDGDFSKIEPATFGALKCEVCKNSCASRLADVVFCDSCYRSYHLYCTYPVLEQVPETEWFCSTSCSKLGTLNCKTCGKATDDNLILICDKCERGAHIYCLSEPLKEIPEGDWYCDDCSHGNGANEISGTKGKHGASSKATASRLASRTHDVLQASRDCKHEHGLRTTGSLGHAISSTHSSSSTSSAKPSSSNSTSTSSSSTATGSTSSSGSGSNSKQSQGNNFLDLSPSLGSPISPLTYLLLSHAIEVPWKDLVFLSQICVDCLIEQDGGVIPPKMGDFVVGHSLLPSHFCNSIFVNQMDDVPYTSMGDLPDPASINAHLDTVISAVDAFVNRAFARPLLGRVAPASFTPPPMPALTNPIASKSGSGSRNGRNSFSTPSRLASSASGAPNSASAGKSGRSTMTTSGNFGANGSSNAAYNTLTKSAPVTPASRSRRPNAASIVGLLSPTRVRSPSSSRPRSGVRSNGTNSMSNSQTLSSSGNVLGNSGVHTRASGTGSLLNGAGNNADSALLGPSGRPMGKTTNLTTSINEWLSEGGYEPNEHCYWIFQANPGLYDINTSLKHLKTMTWVVRQNQSRIRRGDRVFVWESGKDSGVIALGTVVSDPCVSKESPAMREYAKDSAKFDRPDVRCQLHIEHVLPAKLRRSEVSSDPALANMTILRAPIGTNFKVTKTESLTLLSRLFKLHPSNCFKASTASILLLYPNTDTPEACVQTATTAATISSRNRGPRSPPTASTSSSSSSFNASNANTRQKSRLPLATAQKLDCASSNLSASTSSESSQVTNGLPNLEVTMSSNETNKSVEIRLGIATDAIKPELNVTSSSEVSTVSSRVITTTSTTVEVSSASIAQVDSPEVGKTDSKEIKTISSSSSRVSNSNRMNEDQSDDTKTDQSNRMDLDSELTIKSAKKSEEVYDASSDEDVDDSSSMNVDSVPLTSSNIDTSYYEDEDEDESSEEDKEENGERENADIDEEEDRDSEYEDALDSGDEEDGEEDENRAGSDGSTDSETSESESSSEDDVSDSGAMNGLEEGINVSALATSAGKMEGKTQKEKNKEEKNKSGTSDGASKSEALSTSAMDLVDPASSGKSRKKSSGVKKRPKHRFSKKPKKSFKVSKKSKISGENNDFEEDLNLDGRHGDHVNSDSDSDDSDLDNDLNSDDGDHLGDEEAEERLLKESGPKTDASGAPMLTKNRQKLLEVNDKAMEMHFPRALVRTCVLNSRRMRLAMHQGSSIILAVSGGKAMKKKHNNKVPLLPMAHVPPIRTFVASTPSGWKFKLVAVPLDNGPILCPYCSLSLSKAVTIDCNHCGIAYHAQCAHKLRSMSQIGSSSSNSLSSSHCAPISAQIKTEDSNTSAEGSTQNLSSSVASSTPSAETNSSISSHLPPVASLIAHSADFTCPSCVQNRETVSCGKCRRNARTDYISCDSCDDKYHLSCVGMKQQHNNINKDVGENESKRKCHWLCHKCNVPKAALMRIKLALVLRELRLEALRMTIASVEIGAARLKKCIESPDKAGAPISTLATINESMKNGIASIAQQALERWNLYRASARVDFVSDTP